MGCHCLGTPSSVQGSLPGSAVINPLVVLQGAHGRLQMGTPNWRCARPAPDSSAPGLLVLNHTCQVGCLHPWQVGKLRLHEKKNEKEKSKIQGVKLQTSTPRFGQGPECLQHLPIQAWGQAPFLLFIPTSSGSAWQPALGAGSRCHRCQLLWGLPGMP